MPLPLKIGILCGGTGAEHGVDLLAVKDVVNGLSSLGHLTKIIYIAKSGIWYQVDIENDELNKKTFDVLVEEKSDKLIPVMKLISKNSADIFTVAALEPIDLFFPLTDDPIQGFLDSLGTPYVGSDWVGVAVGRDKDICKRLLSSAGLPVVDGIVIDINEPVDYRSIISRLGSTLFVKPARQGSSFGVSKVFEENGFHEAIEAAGRFDRKIIIETAIQGREVEVAVLGDESPVVSSELGEIVDMDGYYTFEKKYFQNSERHIKVPAMIDSKLKEEMRLAGLKAFQVLGCSGMARIDFILEPGNRYYVLEVNTSPGLGIKSMYPKIWDASGMQYKELLNCLVESALAKETSSINVEHQLSMSNQ
ncbi:MAG: D-alanine--D-alanine ligase [Waddliaceae bacterium]|nr:D-alanine--D-alanine ligase [Waddliaceae bacterium]